MPIEFDIVELMAQADRRDFLNAHVPHCPKCRTRQVQIMRGDVPATWRCRICQYGFICEPIVV